MKKTQGLRWGTGTENRWNKGEVREKLAAVGAGVLFDVVCALLFLCAATSMLSEEFSLLEFHPGFYVKLLLMILLVSAVLETAGHLKKLPAAGVKLGTVLAAVFWIIRRMWKDEARKNLVSGLWTIASIYLKDWNSYYDTSWYCPSGAALYAGDSVEFVLLAAVVLLLWVAKCCKKNNVMAVLPALIIVAELLVGNSPTGQGIFLVFAGVLLASNQSFTMPDFRLSEGNKGRMGKTHLFGWLPSIAVLSFLCLAVCIVGRKSAEETITNRAGELEDKIMDTATKIADWEFWRTIEDPGGIENMVEGVLGTIDFDRENVDNEEPKFENVPVLQMTVEKKPEGRIYLKGFYADTYKNGVWEKNADAFVEACEDAGFDAEKVAEELTSLGVKKQLDRYKVKRLSMSEYGLDASVRYLDANTIKAYLPYFIEENLSGLSVDGESNYKKRKSDEELHFTLWQYSGDYETRLTSFYHGTSLGWERWYERYVKKNYLTVPENMPNVERIAAELLNKDLSSTKLGEIDSTNEERLAKAYVVADWLARNTSYSTILPKLPRKADPIEYFLGTTRKGYCMHYASAGVMILRTMGVPARYASGYVVSRGSFNSTKEGYVSEVLDNQAHAWAEIYLDGIGWVPVEMTSGYSALLPTPTPSPTPSPTPTNTPTPEPTNTPTPTLAPTKVPLQESPTPAVTGEPTTMPEGTPIPTGGGESPMTTPVIVPGGIATPTPTPTPMPVLEENKTEVIPWTIVTPGIENIPPKNSPTPTPIPETPIDEEEMSWQELVGKTILVLLVVIVICLLIFSPATIVDKFFRFEKMHHRRMLREMKRRGNGRAIKMVNRAIYRKLCFSNMIKKGCTDKEYEKALKEHYSVMWPEEWDRYMEIVKAAQFSLREFTDEEVEFCYKIYRDIIY